MVVARRKKNSRQRGSKTHGWGAMKKHRGAGNRGGRGMAGTGKRCDSKKPMIWGDPKYFGKHGFKKKNIKIKIKPITIRIVEQKINAWLNKNLIEEKTGSYNIDLKKLGYNKLLSNGKITRKLNINVLYATPKAVEKIKSAGGTVEGIAAAKPKETKKAAKQEPENKAKTDKKSDKPKEE